jgi:hypothetical protein
MAIVHPAFCVIEDEGFGGRSLLMTADTSQNSIFCAARIWDTKLFKSCVYSQRIAGVFSCKAFGLLPTGAPL